MANWTTLVVLAEDARTEVTGEDRIAALRELREEGSMWGRFLGRVGAEHEDADDASTWGPLDREIDWSGFDSGDTLSTDTMHGTIVVRDAEGGVWWPSDEATAEIASAPDPEATALRICREQPTRGRWAA